MGETIAVLFVFFILIILGFIFYVKVIKGNIEQQSQELSQLKSVGIAQRVMFLPELQCTEDNIIRDNCIDLLKLQAAKYLISKNEIYYYDLLEFSDVSISQIYPIDASLQNFNIYSKKNVNYKNKFVTNVPISLYNPISKSYAFGLLTIETLSK